MLDCCNSYFKGYFSYVVICSSDLYHTIEFGRCPKCGVYIFKEFKQYTEGKETLRVFRDKAAKNNIDKWTLRLKTQKQGSFSNQNYYYGDFKKTGRKDSNGNPEYVQLRRNFNGQTEVLNKITTLYTSLI